MLVTLFASSVSTTCTPCAPRSRHAGGPARQLVARSMDARPCTVIATERASKLVSEASVCCRSGLSAAGQLLTQRCSARSCRTSRPITFQQAPKSLGVSLSL